MGKGRINYREAAKDDRNSIEEADVLMLSR